MAINFPDSPSNGDTHTANGVVYTYNSTSTLWDTISGGGGGSSVTVSDTAPTSPSDGDQWFDSTDGSLSVYYNDGSSSQWISTSGPAGAAGVDGTNGTDGTSASPTSYANLAAFPSSGNTAGDLGFATDTKAVYVWDGTEWDRIYTDTNAVPEWTTAPPATANLASDGTATNQTVVASDPEGFPIEYSYDTNPSNQAQATISQSNNAFTITPSTTEANAGEFTLRYKASDGLHSTSRSTTYALSFIPQASNLIGRWDFGNSSSYSGSGTTWTDLSGNNNHLTIGGSGGSYNTTSGAGSDAGYEFTTSTNISFGTILDTAKTVAVIFSDVSGTQDTDFLFFSSSQNSTDWIGVFSSSSSTGVVSYQVGTGSSQWSGENWSFYVNGNNVTARNAAYNALESTKFNSATIRGIEFLTGQYFNWYSGTWLGAHNVRSIAAWNVMLTDTEVQEFHNLFPNMATWDG